MNARRGRGFRVMLLAADGETRTYFGPVYASRESAEEAKLHMKLGPNAKAYVVHYVERLGPLTESDIERTMTALRARRESA